MTFRVGQKVICVIERQRFLTRGGEIAPDKDCVYTVRDLIDAGIFIRLREIVNEPKPYTDDPGECAFDASAFRPAVEHETSIEIFKRLLVPGSKVSEPV